jgi:hypothetical protein
MTCHFPYFGPTEFGIMTCEIVVLPLKLLSAIDK